MNKSNTKGSKANNSTPATQSGERKLNPLVDILRNIHDRGATVTYIFKSERHQLSKEEGIVAHEVESKQITPINPGVLRDERGNKRSAGDIEEIFRKTASDLGATHFYIQ